MLGGVGGSLPFAEYAFAADVIAAIATVRSGAPLVAGEVSVAGTPALLSEASGGATLSLNGENGNGPRRFDNNALEDHVQRLVRVPQEELRKLRLSDDGKLRILPPGVALPVLENEGVRNPQMQLAV